MGLIVHDLVDNQFTSGQIVDTYWRLGGTMEITKLPDATYAATAYFQCFYNYDSRDKNAIGSKRVNTIVATVDLPALFTKLYDALKLEFVSFTDAL